MDNKEKCKQYYREHIEERRAKNREYGREHKEQRKEYRKSYKESGRKSLIDALWRENNRELIRERDRNYRQELKYEVLSHYSVESEPICEDCLKKGIRITNINLLTIDHELGGGNEHRKQIGGGGQATYRWLKRNNFPDGYKVLCFGCNTCERRRNYAVSL